MPGRALALRFIATEKIMSNPDFHSIPRAPAIRGSLLAPLAVVWMTAVASAAVVFIDQESTVGGGGVNYASGFGNGFGQSFTPTASRIEAACFVLGAGGAAVVRLDLFAGEGFGGALLATSQPVDISGATSGPVHFLFSAPEAIIPGTLHTLRLTLIAGDGYVAETSAPPMAGGAYAAGNLITPMPPSGMPWNEFDLVFSEGLVVPEPRVGLLVLTAVLAAMCRRRRRQWE